MKTIIYAILALLVISCLQEEEINQPLGSITPREINDGWEISNPASEDMDELKLKKVYQQLQQDENMWSVRSLLVFRNGKLLSENYFKEDDDISTQHLIWSCTKQFIGVLTGIAVDQGFIESIDDPISKYLPVEMKNHPDKASITIRNLITMQSGIGFENDGVTGQTDKILRQLPDDILEFILDLPMIEEPGTVFHYNDGDPQIMSCLIQKITGMPTDEWADKVLFSKIGFDNYNWVRYKDGATFGGFGIETTPRELGKLARLVLNKGEWNNEQLVSTNWLDQMLIPQVESDITGGFGYYWWLLPEKNIYFTWGHGGQFAFIVPNKDLIAVMSSIPNTQGKYQIQADESIPYVEQIIDCCKL